MTVTSRLFEAYLKCPTKCFLCSRGETGKGNAYADWVCVQNTSYRKEGISRLNRGVAPSECATGPLDERALKSGKWHLAVDSEALAENLESAIDAVGWPPGDSPDKPAQLVPIRFVFKNKPDRHDKLLLAFDALALSEELGREVAFGHIIHGERFVTLRLKTSGLKSDVRKTAAEIATLLAGQVQPDPVWSEYSTSGFSSPVSGFSGAYARRRACVGSVLSMHQGPSLQMVPAETVRAKGFVHATTQICADRQSHARPQSTTVQNSAPQAAAR